MPKSVFTDAHQVLVETIVSARHEAGLLQEELAGRLGKHQSYISNIERGQRRIDVLEFCALARAMSLDPVQLFGRLAVKLPHKIDI